MGRGKTTALGMSVCDSLEYPLEVQEGLASMIDFLSRLLQSIHVLPTQHYSRAATTSSWSVLQYFPVQGPAQLCHHVRVTLPCQLQAGPEGKRVVRGLLKLLFILSLPTFWISSVNQAYNMKNTGRIGRQGTITKLCYHHTCPQFHKQIPSICVSPKVWFPNVSFSLVLPETGEVSIRAQMAQVHTWTWIPQ